VQGYKLGGVVGICQALDAYLVTPTIVAVGIMCPGVSTKPIIAIVLAEFLGLEESEDQRHDDVFDDGHTTI
jgi:hypothetical protein